MNQPYVRVNQPYATLTLASPLREMFRVQLYKNNAHALLSRILSILNLDWLQHARSVRGVYEFKLNNKAAENTKKKNYILPHDNIRQHIKSLNLTFERYLYSLTALPNSLFTSEVITSCNWITLLLHNFHQCSIGSVVQDR